MSRSGVSHHKVRGAGDWAANQRCARRRCTRLASGPDSAILTVHTDSHDFHLFQKGRKGAGVKGAGVANCRIFRSAVPSVVVWSILLVSLSGVKKKL